MYKAGDKFVIEIGQVISGQHIGDGGTDNALYLIKGFNALTFDEYGLNKLDRPKEETGRLKWMTPADGLKSTVNKLYLAYQPGYPLMVADYKTGHGYRDVRTGETISPTMVAYINVPYITIRDEPF